MTRKFARNMKRRFPRVRRSLRRRDSSRAKCKSISLSQKGILPPPPLPSSSLASLRARIRRRVIQKLCKAPGSTRRQFSRFADCIDIVPREHNETILISVGWRRTAEGGGRGAVGGWRWREGDRDARERRAENKRGHVR